MLALAERRLRPGGVLQLVQRGAGDMERERLRWTAVISDIAGDYGLEVVSVTAIAYEEPPVGDGMTVNSLHLIPWGRSASRCRRCSPQSRRLMTAPVHADFGWYPDPLDLTAGTVSVATLPGLRRRPRACARTAGWTATGSTRRLGSSM